MAEFQRGMEADVDWTLAAADNTFAEWRARSYIDRAEYLWDIYHDFTSARTNPAKSSPKNMARRSAERKPTWLRLSTWAASHARHPHGDIVLCKIPTKDAYMRQKYRGIV
jgi:aldehyde dehydrogenase (NAD+)